MKKYSCVSPEQLIPAFERPPQRYGVPLKLFKNASGDKSGLEGRTKSVELLRLQNGLINSPQNIILIKICCYELIAAAAFS